MSLMTLLTMKELKLKCEELCLTDIKIHGKKEAKDDYVIALRNYHLHEYFGGLENAPMSLQLMLQIESPMLACQEKMVKPDDLAKIWTDPNYYDEEKVDGMRLLSMNVDEGKEFIEGYSRNLSVTDLLPISYGNKIYMPNLDVAKLEKLEHKFIVDGELICINPNISTVLGNRGVVTETQLQAVTALMSMEREMSLTIQKRYGGVIEHKLFDCLYYDGEWLLDKPLKERRKYLALAMKDLHEVGYRCSLPGASLKDKEGFHNKVMANGGEGTVLKNINAPYSATSSRSHRNWIKIKRTVGASTEEVNSNDTIDGFITGFEEADINKSLAGMVGAILVSCFVTDDKGNSEIKCIAKISGLSLELRKELTALDDEGNVIMKPEYYNKCVEIQGQAFSARAKRLKHARLIRFRPDRSPDTCILEQSFIDNLIL